MLLAGLGQLALPTTSKGSLQGVGNVLRDGGLLLPGSVEFPTNRYGVPLLTDLALSCLAE